MEVQLSARSAATLVYRLCAPKLSPVAKAAHRHERALERVFLTAIREAQDAVPMSALELTLNIPGTGAPLYVLQPVFDMMLEKTELREYAPYMRIAAERKTVAKVLQQTLAAGARVHAITGMKFDAANPAAIAWAEEHAAELIADVTVNAQAAIRQVVVAGFENGVAPADTAKLIRASIGLTERDAVAVMNYQLKLINDGVVGATAKAEKYAAKLTKSRAQTIARTETMRAANEGQQQLWEQAREAGLLDRTAKKVWIVADPCPICAGMSGETVRIDQTFSIGGDPPAHPNCRCTVGLVA